MFDKIYNDTFQSRSESYLRNQHAMKSIFNVIRYVSVIKTCLSIRNMIITLIKYAPSFLSLIKLTESCMNSGQKMHDNPHFTPHEDTEYLDEPDWDLSRTLVLNSTF